MQAQQVAVTSEQLPSSPPAGPSPAAEGFARQRSVSTSSPTPTAYTALSPTQTLGHSSPELPPLPPLLALGAVPRTPSSVAKHQHTDSTYYTASWGSPYQNPPPSLRRQRPAFDSDDLEEDTSGLQFGLGHLIPSRVAEEGSPDYRFGLEHLLPVRLPLENTITPTRPGVSSYISAPDVIPRSIGSSPHSFLRRTQSQLDRSLSASDKDFPTNITASSVAGARAALESDHTRRTRTESNHWSHKTNLTLTQQDFALFPPLETTFDPSRMLASRYADVPQAGPIVASQSESQRPKEQVRDEKPLPLPPKAEGEGTPIPEPATTAPPESNRATPNTDIVERKVKKKIQGKGRAVYLLLPWDDPRGRAGGRPKPLSQEEVEARFRQFEEAGYDTRGFGHWRDPQNAPVQIEDAQNRLPIIENAGVEGPSVKENATVRIPDKRVWDAYSNFLVEQKLAALGVSLGGDEPPTSMSRQTSSQQASLPFSPPLPTSSANSQRPGQSSYFSAVLPRGTSPGHASTRSIASPMSGFPAMPPRGHMQRHSIYASPAGVHQQQHTPTGQPTWSPQQYFHPLEGMRGGSPALGASRPDPGSVRSPASPFSSHSNQAFNFPQRDELMAQQMHLQQQQLQAQLLHQQQQQQQLHQQQMQPSGDIGTRASSVLQEVPEEEAEAEDDPYVSQRARQEDPEIAVPAPRGHRHNISENLEREIRDAEYHLEQAIDRQLDDGGELSARYPGQSPPYPGKSDNSVTNGAIWRANHSGEQVLHHPQPHSRGHSLTQATHGDSAEFDHDVTAEEISEVDRTNPSEVETNPSVEDKPDRAFAKHSQHHSRGASHASNPWREEFTSPREDSAGHTPFSQDHSRHTSKGSATKLNVQAKEFKFNPNASFNPGKSTFSGLLFQPADIKPFVPGQKAYVPQAPASAMTFGGSQSRLNIAAPAFSPGSSEFSFMSNGPSFGANAIFQQSVAASESSEADRAAPPSASKIFGIINISDGEHQRAARRSKAVPIIRPDEDVTEGDDGLQEDEEGHLVPADSRQKRARRGADDGNDVPQFASTMPLTESSQPSGQKLETTDDRIAEPVGKENRAPVGFDHRKDGNDTRVSYLPPGLNWYANMWKLGDKSNEHEQPRPSQAPLRQHASNHASKSSLSATARPFEFRPGAASFDFGSHISQSSVGRSENWDEDQDSSLPHGLSARYKPSATYQPGDDDGLMTAYEAQKRPPYPESDAAAENQAYPQPSFDEIDDVVKHLDKEGSDFGVEREDGWEEESSPPRDLGGFERADLRPPSGLRSDAPSPSPRRLQAVGTDRASPISPITPRDPFADTRAALIDESPIHRLNVGDEIPISDWDDVITNSEDERKIHDRARFFDSHVNGIIDTVLQSRLGPLERSLHAISNSLARASSRPGRREIKDSTQSGLDSDADDEDDDEPGEARFRSRSQPRDRKLDKIRHVVQEAVATQVKQITPAATSSTDMTEFYQALADMKASIARSVQSAQQEDFREVIEEALQRQSMALTTSREPSTLFEENSARVAELERELQAAASRISEMSQNRAEAEHRENDTLKSLRLAEEELGLLRDSLRDEEARHRSLDEEARSSRSRIVDLEMLEEKLQQRQSNLVQENESLKTKLEDHLKLTADLHASKSDLDEEVVALKATLEEYRISGNQWRVDIRKAHEEREAFRRSLHPLKLQLEEAVRVREVIRDKLIDLQEDMVTAAGQMATERSQWQMADQEYRTKYEVLSARIEAEGRTRERLERELERLESNERDGMKTRLALEAAQSTNDRLGSTIEQLRHEAQEHMKRAERHEREFHEARDAGIEEVQRTRRLLEADVESANNQVNVVRVELETELTRLRTELDNVRIDADTAKAHHELMLEERADAKRQALNEAHESRQIALREQQQHHEQRLHDLQRVHSRELANAVEDKQRVEMLLNERLQLSDAKVEHLQDKCLHLEEKLEVAKSAAQAAIQAAQSAKATPTTIAPTGTNAMRSISHGVGLPEKVSPQALRESIVVLQEQLQERESRLEALERQLSEVDTGAPEKLKERDAEIGWLRELLGVRVDDISELINALSQPAFDRETVRDAAIRIRTNLQMEQQEKERLITASNGTQSFPTLASLSNFASPKAVQLAAALGNWRNRGREAIASNLGQGTPTAKMAGTRQRSAAPTPSTAQGFLSGLMTPPASNVRRTSQTSTPRSSFSNAPLTSTPKASRSSNNSGRPSLGSIDRARPHLSPRQQEKQPLVNAPTTPPLLRQASYDQDAEDGNFSNAGFYDDDESVMDSAAQPLEQQAGNAEGPNPFGRSPEEELDQRDEDSII